MRRGFVFIITFMIIVIVCVVWNRSATNTKTTIKRIMTTKAKDISSITLDKSRTNNLVVHKIKIVDVKLIECIWGAVNVEDEYRPSHPVSEWGCLLEIKTKSGDKFVILVNKLSKMRTLAERGTKITIYTHIESGSILGEFRSDELGLILESLALEKGVYNEKVISKK